MQNFTTDDVYTLKKLIDDYKKHGFCEPLIHVDEQAQAEEKAKRKRKKWQAQQTEFAQSLQRLRQENELYQKELAELTGLKQNKISNYERGKQLPSRQNLKKILDILLPEEGYKRNKILSQYTNAVLAKNAMNYKNMQ